MREAGITAAERYKAELEKEEDGKQASAGVNLDVDQIMHDPGAQARAKRTANAARVQAAAAARVQAAAAARVQAAAAARVPPANAARVQAAAAARAPPVMQGPPGGPLLDALVQARRNRQEVIALQQQANRARRR